MTTISHGFRFRFFWIPHPAGGHSGPPVLHGRTEAYILEGLRPINHGRDIQWEQITYDLITREGVAYAWFGNNVQEDQYQPDQRIIISTGPYVLCIGIVLEHFKEPPPELLA